MDRLPRKEHEKLNPDQSLRLIEQVKRFPCLWCKTTKDYKNINKHATAWAKIANELSISEMDAKQQWKNLQASFRVYRSKVKRSTVTGSGRDEIYTPRWFAYQSMTFLSESLDVVNTTDTIGLARPPPMQSTDTSQAVYIIPDISNSNSPSIDIFDFNDPDEPDTQNTDRPQNTRPAPTAASTAGRRQRRNRDTDMDDQLAVSLQALVDVTNLQIQRTSSRIASNVAEWVDHLDSSIQSLVIAKLYQAMHAIEVQMSELDLNDITTSQ
ncbi:uncharacterized protein LOC125953365 isoform X1 [Anopheles darlingi]|uniref:uncharacterized protein LOC125953365 isoform X1 n=1 Tax=Anopheles darlingi TaxID=43151 RepID=UPI0021002826|nr:uncharacterized protein LOC125953365 isoform X1 [Anopheles darlingi]XP_049538824.1 uncharacterized protein LOC125953365 isoform X1 [Anopheles darlingi]